MRFISPPKNSLSHSVPERNSTRGSQAADRLGTRPGENAPPNSLRLRTALNGQVCANGVHGMAKNVYPNNIPTNHHKKKQPQQQQAEKSQDLK